jgi:hypothetical protein
MSINDYNNVKYTINIITSWLYNLNIVEKEKQKYKNLNNDEYKELYNYIELYIYKTNFSFTRYETNQKVVIICFIKELYNISLACAKSLYKNYKINSNDYLLDMINTDKKYLNL